MFTKLYTDRIFTFEEISKSIKFENNIKGARSATLVDIKDDKLIPLVRTTTQYKNPMQKFTSIHYELIQEIKKSAGNLDLKFNNALIEIHDNYKSMKYHSDQSLDLDPESFICIFSCYDKSPGEVRLLMIKNKETNEISIEEMNDNSFIIFSVDTNSKYIHKIVPSTTCKNKWLGLTLRSSKKLINPGEIRLANEEERQQFYKLKARENKYSNFENIQIDYTISPGDLLDIR